MPSNSSAKTKPRAASPTELPLLLREIRQCKVCEAELPLGARPIVQVAAEAKLLIIGQAPGRKVHHSGIPWDDASGVRLRDWLGISHEQFYDPTLVALVPMGFCFPGSGSSGDMPPRRECADLWHAPLRAMLREIKITLLVGSYAQRHYLPEAKNRTLTANVQAWAKYAPTCFPLPHPSPRNNRWLKNNPWFAQELLPNLRRETSKLF